MMAALAGRVGPTGGARSAGRAWRARARGICAARVIGGLGALFLALACAPLAWFDVAPEESPRTNGDVLEVEAAPAQTTTAITASAPLRTIATEEPRAVADVQEPRSSAEDAAPVLEGESDAESEEAPPTGPLRIERGEGLLALLVPRGEELEFEVEIDLGALGEPTVGRVTLSSGAEPYSEGLPPRGGAGRKRGKEVGWLKSTARGSHLGYSLDHELYVRHLPQVMPRVLFTDTQKGSENRRRKLKVGESDGKLVVAYEHDGHCKGCENREHFVESKWIWGKPSHCDKCKKAEHRKWKEPPLTREVPPGTLDMLSAVYLARTMVEEGLDSAKFSLVDKQKLWDVELTRGKRKVIEVPAGRFECTQVQLVTRVPAGEPRDGEGFQGLFGIQGSIAIWVHSKTGVPVLISGTLPVPVLGDLDVRVELTKFTGTVEGFGPVR